MSLEDHAEREVQMALSVKPQRRRGMSLEIHAEREGAEMQGSVSVPPR